MSLNNMNSPATMEFVKLSGSGNDFICIDNRSGRYDSIMDCPGRTGHFAASLCHRGTGVGADGVIFAIAPEIEGVSDIGARFFEADGSETELCGNGTACFAHWSISAGFVPDRELRILTPAGVVLAQNIDGSYVRVCIPTPEDILTDVEVDVDGRTWTCDTVIVGIPHAVTYVDDVSALDVARWGAAIRRHELFAPKGINANFVQILGEGRIAVRTFEYGVEGETLACGTGSSASAILTAIREGWGPPYSTGEKAVLVQTQSGDVLRVCFTLEGETDVADVCLETIVRFVYTGVLHPTLAERAMDPP